jgi:hypothetical protein
LCARVDTHIVDTGGGLGHNASYLWTRTIGLPGVVVSADTFPLGLIGLAKRHRKHCGVARGAIAVRNGFWCGWKHTPSAVRMLAATQVDWQ